MDLIHEEDFISIGSSPRTAISSTTSRIPSKSQSSTGTSTKNARTRPSKKWRINPFAPSASRSASVRSNMNLCFRVSTAFTESVFTIGLSSSPMRSAARLAERFILLYNSIILFLFYGFILNIIYHYQSRLPTITPVVKYSFRSGYLPYHITSQ